MNSVDLQRDLDRQQALSALVARLDRNITGVTTGQPILAIGGSGLDSLLLGFVKVGKLQPTSMRPLRPQGHLVSPWLCLAGHSCAAPHQTLTLC